MLAFWSVALLRRFRRTPDAEYQYPGLQKILAHVILMIPHK
jgi:hypothetical protein